MIFETVWQTLLVISPLLVSVSGHELVILQEDDTLECTCTIDMTPPCAKPNFPFEDEDKLKCVPYIRRINAIEGIWERLAWMEASGNYGGYRVHKEPKFPANMEIPAPTEVNNVMTIVMRITNFTCRNEGKYQCQSGDGNRSAEMTVQPKIIFAKYLVVNGLKYKATENDTVNLYLRQGFSNLISCVVESSPHKYRWSWDLQCPGVDMMRFTAMEFESHTTKLDYLLRPNTGYSCQVNKEETRISVLMKVSLEACTLTCSLRDKKSDNVVRSSTVGLHVDYSMLEGYPKECDPFPYIVLFTVGLILAVAQLVGAVWAYGRQGGIHRYKWRFTRPATYRRKSDDVYDEPNKHTKGSIP